MPTMEHTDKPSKTRRKKDVQALQALGASLVELSAAQIAEIEMPEQLREAVLEAKRITKHEGRRRQVQYIGRLMREVDPADRLAAPGPGRVSAASGLVFTSPAKVCIVP